MVERSITAVLKTVEARVSGGSNPSLRANGEVEFEKKFHFSNTQFLKRDSRDANIGAGSRPVYIGNCDRLTLKV